MYEITKDFAFSASHVLTGLAPDHPCGRLHGHNYTVRVTLASRTLDEHGFVVDYGELRALGRYIDETLDHRHLNRVLGDVQPSAENLARFLFEWCRSRWPACVAVSVSETARTWATYGESEGGPW